MMGTDESTVSEALAMLQGRNLIREQEPGRWVRKVLDDKTGTFFRSIVSETLENKFAPSFLF